MSAVHQEKSFQREIAEYLEQHGWLHSPNSQGYDKERALYPEDLLGWLEGTAPEDFARIVPPQGTEAQQEKGRRRILDRVVSRLSARESDGGGTLNVLRKGFSVPGARRPFDMVGFPPQDALNPNVVVKYGKNRLRVVQEVVYSSKKADRIDLVLFLNGLPMATVELKTDFTQGLEDAKRQYRQDRAPKGEPLLTEFRGALVHFAVSNQEVAMTTKLAGDSTYFLPFNKGHENGKGNPPVEGGTASSYFWEDLLDRDAWLTLLTKFVYVKHEKAVDPNTGRDKSTASIRFPRYHQWRAVNRMTADARVNGPGQKYLIQHSAGSGKTDSIAWTAHRLASLHTEDGQKVFDTVVVIADRQVLDQQLQDAVDQLVTRTGTFEAITRGGEGSKAQQLTEALASGVPIIGVTLQTFPYALEKMRESNGELAGKRFAVIADEAHSSQSGESSKALKKLLYLAEPPSSVESDDLTPDEDQDALNEMASTVDEDGRISFLAFTATPKEKTLQLFGRPDSNGRPQPFDLYPMKQAIEEGFILDVLRNYTTYDMAARIGQRVDDGGVEHEVDIRKGTRTLINFVELHPTNVSTKVSVILDHYRGTVQRHLGGQAKAMVVTSSRTQAILYQRAFEKAIEEGNYPLKTLVAFSGEVPDPDVVPLPGGEAPKVTESTMTPGLRGRDLAKVFGQDDQNILVVANKFQTGFDQPLLVAMYVDKKLSGISAVQTLSRLNRVKQGKTDTYVLDFVNDAEQIEAAFQEYYEDARVEKESDPDLVMRLMDKLLAQNIFTESAVDSVWREWNSTSGRNIRLSGLLGSAVDRFGYRWKEAVYASDTTELEVLDEFRGNLRDYVKAYAFFSQILHFGDPRFLKLSVYADLLARKLRDFRDDDAEAPDVDVSDVVLTHYRLTKSLEQHEMQLVSDGAAGLVGMTEAGMKRSQEAQRAGVADVIEKVNKYLGDLDVDDQYKINGIDQLIGEMASEERLTTQARHNSSAEFRYSPTVIRLAEDAIWRQEEASTEVVKYLRDMDSRTLVDMLMDFGLYDTLRERGSAG
ncbi:type I restriction endonuclease subunit R [Kocuria soli]|uniref:Type I restriction endonuclease subunit R n=1 Tax=Kocuria soli TaxID=2485125 RepID=A0A3N3ZVN8_9MICC|nr:type I restriction endonuclease [Kocuria soli]ROZ64288.1 type I restriction endonuclease subunit R [Kocuria soli]